MSFSQRLRRLLRMQLLPRKHLLSLRHHLRLKRLHMSPLRQRNDLDQLIDRSGSALPGRNAICQSVSAEEAVCIGAGNEIHIKRKTPAPLFPSIMHVFRHARNIKTPTVKIIRLEFF